MARRGVTPAPAATQGPPAQPRVYSLAPAEYWQLRALVRDVEALEAELLRAQIEIGSRIRAAQVRTNTLLDTLGLKHGFDSKAEYRWNDDRTEIERIR